MKNVIRRTRWQEKFTKASEKIPKVLEEDLRLMGTLEGTPNF